MNWEKNTWGLPGLRKALKKSKLFFVWDSCFDIQKKKKLVKSIHPTLCIQKPNKPRTILWGALHTYMHMSRKAKISLHRFVHTCIWWMLGKAGANILAVHDPDYVQHWTSGKLQPLQLLEQICTYRNQFTPDPPELLKVWLGKNSSVCSICGTWLQWRDCTEAVRHPPGSHALTMHVVCARKLRVCCNFVVSKVVRYQVGDNMGKALVMVPSCVWHLKMLYNLFS